MRFLERPPTWMVLSLLVTVRLVGAQLSPIMDCDEVFNYWEPMHMLLFKRGFQTWEYSPQFALRTYAYLLPYALVALPWALMQDIGMDEALVDKATIFFAVRAASGFLSAVSETLLVGSVRERFGEITSTLTFIFLATNAGMFHASVALLPSSTAMLMVTLGYTAWFRNHLLKGLFCGSCAVLLCWPFVAPMFIPMGFHALYVYGLIPVVSVAALSSLLFAGFPTIVDTHLYGKWVVAMLNLISYNALGKGGDGQGANLYGTEPWFFYIQNLVVNFNVVAILAFASPCLVLLLWNGQSGTMATSKGRTIVYLFPSVFCFMMFSLMDHKEERFLSMLYPTLCVGAALSVKLLFDLFAGLAGKNGERSQFLLRALVVFGVIACGALSLSRSAALVQNFRAPIDIYQELGRIERNHAEVACVGKEWYRFPSHFFVSDQVNVKWIRSGFRGLMPQHFSEGENATKLVHDHFNDLNVDEPRAYVERELCDYLIDLAVGEDAGLLNADGWKPVMCMKFLDTENSPALIRSFYLPYFSQRVNTYANYCLLQRR